MEAEAKGWKMLLDYLPCALDNPLFLEGCMLRALERLEKNQDGNKAPRYGPEARALLERSMNLLVHRHNDPRLPWNRVRLTAYLRKEGRHEAVLALCGGLPPARRPVDLWLVEARTWGELGDLGSAWTAIDSAVKVHPTSYQLWMEAYRIAMARRDGATARRSLDQASKFIGQQGAGPVRWEYELARSEYFFFVEGKTDAAWTHLTGVPEVFVENNRPRLTAQMLLAKKSFVEAYNKVSALLITQPDDTDLQLMQSEAMAGMDAWEALLPHLDSMGENVRERAAYWHLRGLTNKYLANYDQSREDLERAAWMDSFNLNYVLNAGYACLKLNEYERGEQHWRRALKLDPQNRDALLHLAESREMQHDMATAKSLLRECLLHHPNFQKAQEMLLRLDAN
jgi:tetratricopeptide (TPR) repeat protein